MDQRRDLALLLYQELKIRFSTGPRFRLSGRSSGSGVDWEFKLAFRQQVAAVTQVLAIYAGAHDQEQHEMGKRWQSAIRCRT